MNAPAPITLRPEDFPDTDPRLIEAITRVLFAQRDGLMSAVASGPQLRFKEGLRFRTGGGGTAYLDVAADPPPKHAWVTGLVVDVPDLRRKQQDVHVLVTAPYSATWVRLSLDERRGIGGLRFLFAGLEADTAYVCSVGFASDAATGNGGTRAP